MDEAVLYSRKDKTRDYSTATPDADQTPGNLRGACKVVTHPETEGEVRFRRRDGEYRGIAT
jgi:hypothetical protein